MADINCPKCDEQLEPVPDDLEDKHLLCPRCRLTSRNLGPDDMDSLRGQVRDMIALAAAEHAGFRERIGSALSGGGDSDDVAEDGDGHRPEDLNRPADPERHLADVGRSMASLRNALGLDHHPRAKVAAQEDVAHHTSPEVRTEKGLPQPGDARLVGRQYSPRVAKAVLWTLAGVTLLGVIALVKIL